MRYIGTALAGRATASLAQMRSHIRRRNSRAPDVAPFYLYHGERLGLRGDLAYAQALLETNYLQDLPRTHDYGRLGADFSSMDEGVLAHLQHLFGLATTDPLPAGTTLVTPGFESVERGSARTSGLLTGQGADPALYGRSVDALLAEILLEPAPGEPYEIVPAWLEPGSPGRPGLGSESGQWHGLRGLVIHRSRRPEADARAVRRAYERTAGGSPSSTHFVLDDRSILQLVPVGEVALHTPGKNLTHLGIELCENRWGTAGWQEAYNRLVWLTAYLLRTFQLDITAVTARFWWDPSAAGDPTSPGWTPRRGREKGLFDWNQFIANVLSRYHRLPMIDVELGGTTRTRALLFDSIPYVALDQAVRALAPGAALKWRPGDPAAQIRLPRSGKK